MKLVVSDGRAQATDQVVVQTEANKAPSIDSLGAAHNPVLQNAETTVTASASDPYNDSLSYSWSLDNDDWTKSGGGTSITLQAPDSDGSSVQVTVTVEDGNGASATSSIDVTTKGCSTGTANCDGKRSNGCEIDLTTDDDNCGACGNTCGSDKTCFKSSCKKKVYKSCQKRKEAGWTTDGVYKIDPDGRGGSAPFDAYCDMTRDGGGWTLVMQAQDNQPDDSNWCQNSTYNVPSTPKPSDQTFKYADGVINEIRGSSGIYRLDGDGSNQHFLESHTYDHGRDIQNASRARTYWTNPQFSGSSRTETITNGSGHGIATDHGGSYQTNHSHGDCYAHANGNQWMRLWVR